MYEFIEGEIVERSPTQVIIKAGPIAYLINISLNTYSQLSENGTTILYLHHLVREDAELLYGFVNREERLIFRLLISVSGVGANTARLILSSMTPAEVKNAILTENVPALQNIKGIGAKSAQRIIVDLRDKVGKAAESDDLIPLKDNTVKEEALSALVALGFPRRAVEKNLEKVLKEGDASVEQVVKAALKLM